MVKGLGIMPKRGEYLTRDEGIHIDSEKFYCLEYIVKGDHVIINDYRGGQSCSESSGTLAVGFGSISGFIAELKGIYESFCL